MTPEQTALLEMYKEHASQARQHETQRERMTAAVVAIAAALVALVSANLKPPVSLGLLAPGVFLVFLGCYAAVFSRKHYERNRLHTTIMGAFRRELERTLQGTSLAGIRRDAETQHNGEFPRLSGLSLHGFWDWLNGSVAIVGLVLVVVVLIANTQA